jgi:pilus assembly protein Flp/PilA
LIGVGPESLLAGFLLAPKAGPFPAQELRRFQRSIPILPAIRDSRMKDLLKRFVSDQSAVTAIEHGLIAGLIAVVIIGAVSKLGKDVSTKFNAIASNLS